MPSVIPRIAGGSASFQGESSIQIQEDFAGSSLFVLAGLGLQVYSLIPDYRDRCPLCLGRDCAVRHGLYFRRVIDREGRIHDAFPIPRFKCRRKGPAEPQSSTFSVLPAELISRRGASLPLVVRILSLFLSEGSMTRTLDALAETNDTPSSTWFPEPATLYRLVRLAGCAEARLRLGPAIREPPSPITDLRSRVRRLLHHLGPPARAAPSVLGFHQRHFPHLLFPSSP
jgi:hypothetical protein